METIGLTVLIMAAIGLTASILLYMAAKKFHVEENPRISQIEELLPGANCGGCGFNGCHDFAVNFAKAASSEGLVCPGACAETMRQIADIAGLTPPVSNPRVAVVHCAGDCGKRREVAIYDGTGSCAIEAMVTSGETACAYGCLGYGDCAANCPYDALHIDPETHLPIVDISKCTGCGKCTKSCPHSLIELVDLKPDKPLVWVACANHDKGGVAMKECDVSCIGCGKCLKVCSTSAIRITEFSACIDSEKCTGCGECIPQCPRNSIHHYGNCQI